MATRRKNQPVRGDGRGGETYADFITGLCNGTIHATAVVDQTVPDGTQQVRVPVLAQDGTPQPDVILTVPARRLVRFDYDDPTG